jgi:hypothetical protein
MEIIVIVALIAYAGYHLAQIRSYRQYDIVPRVHVPELVARMASADSINVQIADVRSHGYYDVGAERIAGSIRIEPNQLEDEIKHLPKDKDIYLYCT